MEIGDIVKPKPESLFILVSGCDRYDKAIVVSLDPFVLVSEGTDMKWQHTIQKEWFDVIDRATPKLLKKCLKRL
jgi:hypothetical protein